MPRMKVSKNKPKRPAFSNGFDDEPQKAIAELAREQGVKPIKDLDDLAGHGRDLWRSDKEFEDFVKGIYERRKRGR